MATQVILKAERRDGTGKSVTRKLRQAGKVPAVLYGAGAEPVSLTLDAHQVLHTFQAISVENTIVNLEVEGEKAPVATLVREVQLHPYRTDLIHVDFLRVQKGVAVELEIPVHLVGTPAGVRNDGGVLDHNIHTLHVSCIPSAIPESIDVDVSALEIGDSVHLRDVEIPKGVEVLMDLDLTICAVHAPRVVVSEDDEAEDAAEPEVIGEAPSAEETEESAEG